MTRDFRTLLNLTLFLLIAVLGGTALAKDEIAVIVANDTPDFVIDTAMLRNIYLKKILIDENGQPYIPINLPPDDPLRRSLTETLFKKSTQQLQDYWNQRYFHGITPPYVLHSQEAVVQFVAKTPGAIGYIAACRLDNRVKPVMSLSASPSQLETLQRQCLPAQDATP